MLESLDSLIATIAIVFVLSLIVQAVQQILKQLLCMKSAYMERELVMMFLTDDRLKSLADQRKKILNKIKPQWLVLRKIPEGEKLVVKDLKVKMQSIGYRDLEILENLNVDTFIDILRTLPMFSKFERETVDKLQEVEYEARKWFDIAKRAFQDHYERRMKLWAFILSGIVVMTLNANIFSIFKNLSTNEVLRESIVASVPTLLSTASDSAHNNVPDAMRDSIIKHEVGLIESYISDKSLALVRWNSANGDSLSRTI
ncbi:MAG: hypothetical protein HY800_04125, partial [Ignavibacteriales bacterium]|nr:hypothetical protein [Ignavibacteriales bacterium]